MPKKKKGSSSKKTSSSSSSSPEEDENEMKRKKLIQTAKQLKENIENEALQKRNFETKLEQLLFYWNIEKGELQTKKEEYERRKSNESERRERHENKITAMKEEMKFTLYKQQVDLIEKKNEAVAELYQVRGVHSVERRKREHRTMECQHHLRNMELSHNNLLAQLRYDHDEEVRQLQEVFKLKFHEITTDSERKVKETKEDVETQIKDELKALEEKKDRQVQELVGKHEEVSHVHVST